MVLPLSSALLFGAFIHSIRGQTTTAPPASTPTVGPTPLPLTQYTFTYPNLVRRRCLPHVVGLTLSFLAAAASLPFQFWTWTSDWLQYLQLDHGTSSLTNEQSVMGVDVRISLQEGPESLCQTLLFNSITGPYCSVVTVWHIKLMISLRGRFLFMGCSKT